MSTNDCLPPWGEAEAIELDTDADILAIERSYYANFVAVGTGGVVIHYNDGRPSISNPTSVTLRGVSNSGGTVVVGDGGTIFTSDDNGANWTERDSGTSEDLLAIDFALLGAGEFHIAIAAEQVLYSTDYGHTWTIVTPPAGGWGGLRAVFSSDDQVFVVGQGGSAWATDNPAGTWLAQELGTTDTLIGGGGVSAWKGSALAVATPTTVLRRDPETQEWTTIETKLDGEIAAIGSGFIVTKNGSVYDISESGGLERIANVGLVPRAIAGDGEGLVVAGEGGQVAEAEYHECIGGRPWVIDGQPTTAELINASAWSGEVEATRELAPELREQLAAAWARDGQFEHASVASFARVVSELMELGAPPELILASRKAIIDELDHAQRCFALASRHAGTVIGPGPLPLAREPRRDLAEVAIALFEEGCINESVAAAEAAVAASECSDPQARATLERIAADEREHAALAWKNLRWMLDTHAQVVGPALRSHVAKLRAPLARSKAGGSPGALELALREHGRLPADERAAIQREVFAGLILPLARELLGGSPRAHA